MELYPGEAQVILLWAPIAVITLGVIVCGALAFIAAPYGRYVSSSWGPVVPARVRHLEHVARRNALLF